jgi:hypothetical protein
VRPLNSRASPFCDGFNRLRFGCWLAGLISINFYDGPFNRSFQDFPGDTLLHSPFNSLLNRFDSFLLPARFFIHFRIPRLPHVIVTSLANLKPKTLLQG